MHCGDGRGGVGWRDTPQVRPCRLLFGSCLTVSRQPTPTHLPQAHGGHGNSDKKGTEGIKFT